jgi:tetratricopeptide (TPR) repeat protein
MFANRIVASALFFGTAIAISSTAALAGPENMQPQDASIDGEPNRARREWMNKGNAEYVQKHWETARDYYLKSWDIKHHYTIAANLADVEMKLGHYAEAAGYLKYALANIPDSKAKERKATEEQLLECRNHLTAVRVATDVTDATVLVDGRDVGQTPLREELLLEPGKHVISVTKPGYGNKTEELSAEGNQVDVTITLEKLATEGPPRPPPPAAPIEQVRREPPKPENKSYRLGSYIGFAVGAVGVGVGTYFLIKAHGTQSDSDSQFASCLPHCSPADKGSISDLDQAAKNQQTVGVVGLIVGGIGVGTGVTLLMIEPKKESAITSGFVRPWFGFGQAGLYGAY